MHVALHAVTWCMGVWYTQNVPRWQQFHVAPPIVSAVSTPLQWIFKNALYKGSHSCRITCKRSESAREWRIALYKSDQQQKVVFDSRSQMGLVSVTAIQQGGQFSSVGDILSVLFNGGFNMELL